MIGFYYLDTNMTTNYTVTWQDGSLYDAARVAGTFIELQQQFFQHHNFTILPYPSPNSIYIPDINYKMLLSWKKASSYHIEDYALEILRNIEEELNQITLGTIFDTEPLQQKFATVQKEFDQSLAVLFPHIFTKILSITIITTKFGAEGSFDYKKKHDGYDIFIWIRTTGITKNSIISHLLHCIVSSLVLISTKVSDSTTIAWKQREAIVDFLLQHTTLQPLWQHVHTLPVIDSKQKSRKRIQDSQIYLEKLQCILQKPRVVKKGNEFFIDSIRLEDLSEKETKLMSQLFNKKNRYVDKNILFDELYGEEGGSDWALSKLVERLRKKIEKIGISSSLLVTSRRQGYMLLASD